MFGATVQGRQCVSYRRAQAFALTAELSSLFP